MLKKTCFLNHCILNSYGKSLQITGLQIIFKMLCKYKKNKKK